MDIENYEKVFEKLSKVSKNETSPNYGKKTSKQLINTVRNAFSQIKWLETGDLDL